VTPSLKSLPLGIKRRDFYFEMGASPFQESLPHSGMAKAPSFFFFPISFKGDGNTRSEVDNKKRDSSLCPE